jgi:hypothetical protein
VAVYPGDGLGDVGADYIRLNISRPDAWAFEHLGNLCRRRLPEARSGMYGEAVIKFSSRNNDRARDSAARKIMNVSEDVLSLIGSPLVPRGSRPHGLGAAMQLEFYSERELPGQVAKYIITT